MSYICLYNIKKNQSKINFHTFLHTSIYVNKKYIFIHLYILMILKKKEGIHSFIHPLRTSYMYTYLIESSKVSCVIHVLSCK